MRRYFLLLLTIVLLVVFQNCSLVKFQSLEGSDPETFKGLPNNGTGYGGKPEGIFYRWEPDFTCEAREAPVAILEITPTRIRHTANRRLLCGAVIEDLDPALVDSSIYQSEIIGYREGIYKGATTLPSSIPANLVEIWCRDRNDEQGIETITHYNRETREAVTRLFYSIEDPQGGFIARTVPDFSVARVVEPNRVTVRNGTGFEVTVYRDRPAAQAGLFEGDLQALIDGRPVTRPTFCRLGGSLDPRVWPSRLAVDFPIETFKFSPDGAALAYTAKTGEAGGPGTTVPHLFSLDINGANHLRVGAPLLTAGVRNFEFTPDSSALLYWGDARVRFGAELFRVNRDGTGQAQINETLTHPLESQDWTIRFSPDGTQVYYKDGHQEAVSANQGTDIEMWLRSVPLTGGTPIVINPPLPLADDVGVYDFAISKQLNRIAYLAGGPYPELFTADLRGAGNVRVPLLPSDPYWKANWGFPLTMPDPGNYLYIRGTSIAPTKLANSYLVLAMDGSTTVQLPDFHIIHATSPNGHFVVTSTHAGIYQQGNATQNVTLTDLRTGRALELAVSNAPFFTSDSDSLVVETILPDGRRRAVAIATSNGSAQELCPMAEGAVVKVKEISDGRLLLATFDKARGLMSIYTKFDNSECEKRNAIPMQEPFVRNIEVSQDMSKALIHTAQLVAPTSFDRLFYVPLNGLPPYVVDSPLVRNAGIDAARFIGNGSAVLYIGQQVTASERHAYIWSVPPR